MQDFVKKVDCDNHVKDMTDELKEVTKSVNNLTVTIAKMPKMILDEAVCKFASKNTEKIVYGLITLICVAVIGSVVNSVVVTNKSQVDEQAILELIEHRIDAYDKENFEITE